MPKTTQLDPNCVKCTICELYFNSSFQLKQHIAGRKHTRLVAGSSVPELETDASHPITEEVLESPSSISGTFDPLNLFEGEIMHKFLYDICKVVTNSQSQIDDHLNGKNHKSKIKGSIGACNPKTPDLKEKSNQFYCNICKVEAPTQSQIDDHLNGKTHKSKLPTRKITNNPQVKVTKKPTPYTHAARARIVCMDLLNFSGSFFTIQNSMKKELPLWQLEIAKATKKAKAFANAARRANIEIVGFIDKSISTEEAQKKWRSRRKKELRQGRRNVVTNMNLWFGEIMKEQGIRVHYSTIDCDDTIAAFALHLGADVLSQDQDYFRYFTNTSSTTPFSVYSSFTLGKFLKLTPHPGPNPNKPKQPSKRKILDTLPHTRDTPYFLDMTSPYQITQCPEAWLNIDHCYTRGCASNLTRLFPNTHITAKPLRLALYRKIGVDRVREEFATWDFQSNSPEFREETVEADPAMIYLLDKPKDAVDHFFGGQKRPANCSLSSWRNHQFSQRAVVAELCSWATGTSVLGIIKSLPDMGNERKHRVELIWDPGDNGPPTCAIPEPQPSPTVNPETDPSQVAKNPEVFVNKGVVLSKGREVAKEGPERKPRVELIWDPGDNGATWTATEEGWNSRPGRSSWRPPTGARSGPIPTSPDELAKNPRVVENQGVVVDEDYMISGELAYRRHKSASFSC